MIYQDYMRRKMHNVVKLDTKEGYPLTVYSCANTNLKDYTIYGNTGGVGDKFEPYNKYKIPITVTGKNLFDYNYYFMNKAAFEGTSSNDNVSYKLKPNTQYIVSSNYPFSEGTSLSVFFVKTGKYSSSNAPTTAADGVWEGNNRTVTTDDEGFLYIASRNSSSGLQVPTLQEFDTGRYWISLEEGTSATSYEPYHEPVTTNIFRDAQLGQGESINYKSDSLPDITLKKGTNIITADTEVKPSNIKIKYLKK